MTLWDAPLLSTHTERHRVTRRSKGILAPFPRDLTLPDDPLNPVADWRFDPITGDVLPDYSGRRNHGACSGGTSWQASPYGLALMRGVFWILDIEAMLSGLLNQGGDRRFTSKLLFWII